MKLGIYEILEKADKAPLDQKAEILQKNFSGTLADIFRLAYHEPKIEWALTKKTYKHNPNRLFDLQASLYQSMKKIGRYFLKDSAPHLTNEKRDLLWIQFLETLDDQDAKMMESIRRGKMPFKSINRKLVDETFPGLLTDEVVSV